MCGKIKAMKKKYNLDDAIRLIFIASIVVFLVSAAFYIYKGSNEHGSLPILLLFASCIAFVAFLILLVNRKQSRAHFLNTSSPHLGGGFVFLFSTEDAMEAEIIKQLLKTNGITAILRREVAGSFGSGLSAYANAYLGQSSLPFGVVNVYVGAKYFDKIKKIIQPSLMKDMGGKK